TDDAPDRAAAAAAAFHGVQDRWSGTPALRLGGAGGPAPAPAPPAVRTLPRALLVHRAQPLGHHPRPGGRFPGCGGADVALAVPGELLPHVVGYRGRLRCGFLGRLIGGHNNGFLSGFWSGSVRRRRSRRTSDPPHTKVP